MKNILLISSGLSPQVITETLFYYQNSNNSILIDEIHVITDSTGARLIDNKLFNGPGWYYLIFLGLSASNHLLLNELPVLKMKVEKCSSDKDFLAVKDKLK